MGGGLAFSQHSVAAQLSIHSEQEELSSSSAPERRWLLPVLFFNINEAPADCSPTLTCGVAPEQNLEASFLSGGHRGESCCHTDAPLSSPRLLPPAESPARQHSRAPCGEMVVLRAAFKANVAEIFLSRCTQ